MRNFSYVTTNTDGTITIVTADKDSSSCSSITVQNYLS